VKPEHGYLARASSLEDATNHWLSGLLGKPWSPDLPSNVGGVPNAMVEEIASPAAPNRSIVLISLRQDSTADNFAAVFLDRSQSRDITGSVSLLRGAKFNSYSLGGPVYHVGDITQYTVMRIWLTKHYLLLLVVVTFLSLLAGWWGYGWLRWHAQERLMLSGTKSMAD
jgi:cellulose synthase (UDP-forming)